MVCLLSRLQIGSLVEIVFAKQNHQSKSTDPTSLPNHVQCIIVGIYVHVQETLCHSDYNPTRLVGAPVKYWQHKVSKRENRHRAEYAYVWLRSRCGRVPLALEACEVERMCSDITGEE
jgi:hypothetical protein